MFSDEVLGEVMRAFSKFFSPVELDTETVFKIIWWKDKGKTTRGSKSIQGAILAGDFYLQKKAAGYDASIEAVSTPSHDTTSLRVSCLFGSTGRELLEHFVDFHLPSSVAGYLNSAGEDRTELEILSVNRKPTEVDFCKLLVLPVLPDETYAERQMRIERGVELP